MAGRTIVTDGKVIGDTDFLMNYCVGSVSQYESKRTILIAITPNENKGWQDYHFSSGGNDPNSILTLREEMSPIVRNILGLSPEESLERTVVQTFYYKTEIAGFTRRGKKPGK